MPLALRAPPRSSSLALCGSLRLILPLEGLPGDVANDFPAALDFLDGRHSLLPPSAQFEHSDFFPYSFDSFRICESPPR